MREKPSISSQSDQSSHSVHGKKLSPFFHQSSESLAANSRQSFFTPLIQPKLTVNAPDDKYEQEADRVADAVMRMPDPQYSARRKKRRIDCNANLWRKTSQPFSSGKNQAGEK